MKKVLGFLTSILMIALAAPSNALGSQSFGNLDFQDSNITAAEIETADAEFSDPGFLPGHPLYFLKSASEKFRLLITFDEDERAKLHLKFAKIRLAEAKKLTELNRTEHAKEKLNEFSMELNQARASRIDVKRESEELTGKSAIVLARVLDKVPEQAKPSVELALNNSVERRVRIREENIHGENKTKTKVEIEAEIKKEIEDIKKSGRELKRRPGKDKICIQVVTPARNRETGEVREFSTPCDVPEEWEQVSKSSEEPDED